MYVTIKLYLNMFGDLFQKLEGKGQAFSNDMLVLEAGNRAARGMILKTTKHSDTKCHPSLY